MLVLLELSLSDTKLPLEVTEAPENNDAVGRSEFPPSETKELELLIGKLL
jgi:hypothetical protein